MANRIMTRGQVDKRQGPGSGVLRSPPRARGQGMLHLVAGISKLMGRVAEIFKATLTSKMPRAA